jgi:GNAT superfamily N-acetyltransferase
MSAHPMPRVARADDLEQIVALLSDDCIGQTREDSQNPFDPRYRTVFAVIEADPNQMIAVLDEGGTVIGCLQLSFIPGLSRFGLLRGQIESVRVARARRGEGLGHTLLAWAIEQCRARGCGLIQLTTDKRRAEAKRFYERLGFQATHEGMKLKL